VSSRLIKASGDLLLPEKPDLIVMIGDFISGSTKFLSGSIGAFKREYVTQCADALSHLKAPLGI